MAVLMQRLFGVYVFRQDWRGGFRRVYLYDYYSGFVEMSKEIGYSEVCNHDME